MKKTFFIINAIALMVTVSCPTATKGQRDTRFGDDRHIFGLSGAWSRYQAGESGVAVNLSYDQLLKGVWWLGIEGNLTATRTTPDTTPFLPQELVGVNVKFGPRFEWGAVYVHPAVLAGVGMVAQNRVLFQDITVPQSLPFLCPQAGARVEFGAQLGGLTLGVYAEYIRQFAQLQPFRLNGAELKAEWLSQHPLYLGATLGLAINNGTRHHGGNNVPIVEGFGAYGTKGGEAGAKLIWNCNTGLPWLLSKDPGLRGEFIASNQYGVRFAESFGDVNRTSVQLGYGLSLHPNGPESAVLYRMSLWAGLGEAGHSSSFGVNQENGSYEGSLSALQTGFKGNAEVDVSFRIPAIRRFYVSVLGGVSYTKVFGTRTSGNVNLTSASFENPLVLYCGVALGWSL